MAKLSYSPASSLIIRSKEAITEAATASTCFARLLSFFLSSARNFIYPRGLKISVKSCFLGAKFRFKIVNLDGVSRQTRWDCHSKHVNTHARKSQNAFRFSSSIFESLVCQIDRLRNRETLYNKKFYQKFYNVEILSRIT